MFNKDHFIQDCIKAVAEGQGAVREVVAEAVSDSARVISELGEPEHAGLSPIYKSPDLTIINFDAWEGWVGPAQSIDSAIEMT